MNEPIGPFNTVLPAPEKPDAPKRSLERRQAPYFEGSFFEGGVLQMIFFTRQANPFLVVSHAELKKNPVAYEVLRSVGIPDEMIGQAMREPRRRLYAAAQNWWATNAERFGGRQQDKTPAFMRPAI